MNKPPSKKQVARARRLVADPGFKVAMLMHAFLGACYGPGQKAERHAAYRAAGIHKTLAAAERRTRSK
jgi:hypothetical protein